jgi:NitT/TauT family transport system substrate-binding protein
MSIEDVEHVNMDQADAGAAFVAERVDAAVTWEPWLSRARDTEHGHVLTDTSENPGLIVDVLLAPVEVIESRRDDFRRSIEPGTAPWTSSRPIRTRP